MEIDEVIVPRDLWARCSAGDDVARKELAGLLRGIELYFHIIHYDAATHMVVTLRDLEGANVVDYVTVGGQFTPGIVIMTREDGSKVELHTRDNDERS